MKQGDWTSEHIGPGESHRHRVTKTLYEHKGEHHCLDIIETESYGRGLFLDGRIQHLEHDEYIYSEMITHPAVTLLDRSDLDVLVVGGGPGGGIRELLKHDTIDTITQVEIDEGIIALTKKYFQHIACGYHEDPRVEIIINDIHSFTQRCDRQFDLIIYDVSEPMESSPACDLFSNRSLAAMMRLLTFNGAFVTWGGSVGPQSSQLAVSIHRSINQIFPCCEAYLCHPQSYGTSWLTVIGSMQNLAPLSRSASSINAYLDKHVRGDLKLYDGQTHHHGFNLPKDVRAAINTQTSDAKALQLSPEVSENMLEETV